MEARAIQEQKIARSDNSKPRPEGAPQAASPGRKVSLGLAAVLAIVTPFFAWLFYRRHCADPKHGPAAASGPLAFACSNCGKHLKANAEVAGKKVKCPQCGMAMQVPAPEPASTESTTATGPDRSAGAKKWWIAACLVLSLVGALILWLYRPYRPPMVGVVVGCEFVPEVEESGFHDQQYGKNGRPFRWTNGDAALTIPIDPKNPPAALRLNLRPWRPPQVNDAALKIVVNQRELFHEKVDGDGWERVFDLTGIVLGEQVVVQIVSDTFVPNQAIDGAGDSRALGVEVLGVELLAGVHELRDLAANFLGRKAVPGVQETGFYGQHYGDQGQPFRWTNGNAKLVIPIDPDKVPQALEVQLRAWRPRKAPPASLRIVANGHELFNERVSGEPWEASFDLRGVRLGGELVLEIASDTFVPKDYDGGSDTKPRGVEVRGVKLR